MSSSKVVEERIAALEQAAMDGEDPYIMALKVSDHSDMKKYNFCDGLQHDLEETRHALRICCDCCGDSTNVNSQHATTFATLFQFTEGRIANLNRVLQNLKRAGEISFVSECFLMGMSNSYQEKIVLLPNFFESNNNEVYSVSPNNVHRASRLGFVPQQDELGTTSGDNNNSIDIMIPREQRKGRSYEEENLATMHCQQCFTCQQEITNQNDRIAVRGNVYHLQCLTCATCGASFRRKQVFMTFDGCICCTSDCLRQYDGAHRHQNRDNESSISTTI